MIKLIDGTNVECYRNLSQHYEAEFSTLTGKKPDTNGLYTITDIDASHEGYLYYTDDGLPIGFAVVDTKRERYDIAEFYVIPTERRRGIGRDLAFAIFDKYIGLWQVRQISGADKAYNFWVAVINAYTKGNFTNQVKEDSEWEVVRIQRFVAS